MRKAIFILTIFILTNSFVKPKPNRHYISRNKDGFIELILSNKNQFHIHSNLGKDCWSWYDIFGSYSFVNDSLVLTFKEPGLEPTCRIIDTFKTKRELKLVLYDYKNKMSGNIDIGLKNDTHYVGYFPKNYIDTILIANSKSERVVHTYYAPNFSTKTKSINFYEPNGVNLHLREIRLKKSGKLLIGASKYKNYFLSVDTLKLE